MKKTSLITITLFCLLFTCTKLQAQCSYTSIIMGWTIDLPEYWTLKIINSSKGLSSAADNNDDAPPPPPKYKDVIADSSNDDTPPPMEYAPPRKVEPDDGFQFENVVFTYYDGSAMTASLMAIPKGATRGDFYKMAMNTLTKTLKDDGVEVNIKKKGTVKLGGKTFEKILLKKYRDNILEMSGEVYILESSTIFWITMVKYIEKDKDNYDVMMNVLAQAAKDSKL